MAISHRDLEIGTLILENYFSKIRFLGFRESHSVGGKTGKIMQDILSAFQGGSKRFGNFKFSKVNAPSQRPIVRKTYVENLVKLSGMLRP